MFQISSNPLFQKYDLNSGKRNAEFCEAQIKRALAPNISKHSVWSKKGRKIGIQGLKSKSTFLSLC
jgi:hypothetical protein